LRYTRAGLAFPGRAPRLAPQFSIIDNNETSERKKTCFRFGSPSEDAGFKPDLGSWFDETYIEQHYLKSIKGADNEASSDFEIIS